MDKPDNYGFFILRGQSLQSNPQKSLSILIFKTIFQIYHDFVSNKILCQEKRVNFLIFLEFFLPGGWVDSSCYCNTLLKTSLYANLRILPARHVPNTMSKFNKRRPGR